MEIGGLQKINLDTEGGKDPREESVLVPKIDLQNQGQTEKTSVPKQKNKAGIIILSIFGVILLFIIYNVLAGFIIYQKAMKLNANVTKLINDSKTQDIAKIKSGIEATKSSLNDVAGLYKLISWEKFLPFAGTYIADGGHAIKAGQAGLSASSIVLTTIEPYSDLLGLKGSATKVLAAKTGEQTTQERINFIIKTIPDILPKIDAISAQVQIISDEISQVNPDNYPEKFKGKLVRSQIKNIQGLVSEAGDFIVNGKPFLESSPFLLGMDSPRTYLILFQNDKELRPTGGFMTAYAIMKVDKAKFEPVSSSDIYTLDAQYKPTIKAPDPIIKYLKGPYVISQNLRLRDMNWSPDFPTSMQTFTDAISKVGIKNIDGIIAVDTHLLVNLLDAIGQIGVPGFGNFSTKIIPECNCPQVIHELEAFADVEGPIIWDPLTGKIIQRPKNSDNRKRIIGPLMNSILANALGQPKEKLPALAQAAFMSLAEKHVLFYLNDSKVEDAVAGFGVGAKIKDYGGDYLHINDANLGGRKSNLYASEDVEQQISVSRDGTITKTLTITYKNPEKQDGWLNSVLPTWVRVYVPKGSTLITSEGLETKADPYEDLGKTVFAGFFQLRPEGVSRITFQYKLPFKVGKEYKLLIQKQSGTDGFLYTINLGKHTEEFYLKTDKEIKIPL